MQATKNKKPIHQFGRIEEGKFQGRRIIITEEMRRGEETPIAMVEKGVMMGSPHFQSACMVHEVFIPAGGCPECKGAKG